MKHAMALLICFALLPVLVGAVENADGSPAIIDHVLRLPDVGHTPYTGTRAIPTVVDKIPLSSVNALGYCWGLAYDWERDCLWVTQWSSAYNKMYAIQKTSPCVKVDSVTLGSGVPTYRLGIGYGGSDVMYMAGYNGQIYAINMTTGTGSVYRATPWSSNEGLGFNAVDDAVYCGDWTVDLCGYAQPAQTGSWTTWSLTSVSGLSGAHSGSVSPDWLFTVNEDVAQAYFYQHSLTSGVPNTTPDSVWQLPAGMTQASTADCAFDGQYVYVLDQAGPDTIWVFDIGLSAPAAYFWDFETGEQGWTHTNGGTFPAAWDVVSSSYTIGSYTIAPPDAGDSSFCIDGDLGGICHDTAMSPVVDNPGFAWFKWATHFQQYVSYQTFTVIMRTFSSGIWNPWTAVWTYTADTSPRYDSVDVSAVTADSVQVGFVYDQPNATYAWFAAFDNVELVVPPSHDVGCFDVVSPPEGPMASGNYDVIGWIRNLGTAAETFDVVAHVYDTVGMSLIFDQTINLTLDAGADTNLNFGSFGFDPDMYFYTEIYTMLSGDADPSNDTSSVYSRTAMGLGDVIFELDVETITGNNRLLGVEFDGVNFYVTGGTGTGTNSIWVVDTSGTLVTQVTQPTSSTWGMRDLAWDDVYAGSDRIDTLYASDEAGLYKFGIDLTGSFTSYGTFAGPVLPCRALGWDGDDEWFFTANWSPYYKFSKSNPNIQTTATGPGSSYGAAYDTDPVDGGWVWWHSQTGASGCQIDQMEPAGMTWPGVTFAINPTITTGIAGGLCFYEGFRNMDVLFALVQGTPDAIVGVFVRTHGTGVETGSTDPGSLAFGFAPMANPVREHASISYAITRPGMVSLKVYDRTGRLVETLVNSTQNAGTQSVTWDARNVANGVYFVKLEAENQTAVQKLILVH